MKMRFRTTADGASVAGAAGLGIFDAVINGFSRGDLSTAVSDLAFEWLARLLQAGVRPRSEPDLARKRGGIFRMDNRATSPRKGLTPSADPRFNLQTRRTWLNYVGRRSPYGRAENESTESKKEQTILMLKNSLKILTVVVLAGGLSTSFAADPAAPKKENVFEKAAEDVKNETEAVADTVESQVDKTLGKPLPFQIDIATVNAKKKMFTSKNKDGKVVTFHITDRTEITKNGVVAKVSDLKAGEHIRGTRFKTGEADWEVIKVMIGPKEEAEGGDKKEKKEKKE